MDARRVAKLSRPGALRRILVRGTNWIGDAVLTTPALAALRAGFPQAKIAVLVKPAIAELLAGHPAVDEIVLYRDPGPHTGLGGKLSLARQLSRARYELPVLFQNAFDAANDSGRRCGGGRASASVRCQARPSRDRPQSRFRIRLGQTLAPGALRPGGGPLGGRPWSLRADLRGQGRGGIGPRDRRDDDGSDHRALRIHDGAAVDGLDQAVPVVHHERHRPHAYRGGVRSAAGGDFRADQSGDHVAVWSRARAHPPSGGVLAVPT